MTYRACSASTRIYLYRAVYSRIKEFLSLFQARLREEEVAATIEDVELKGLELEAQRATLEQEVLATIHCLR